MAPRDPKYRRHHDEMRKRFALAVKRGGVLCSRCFEPINPSESWDLDHVEGTIGEYRGASHRRCNRKTATHRAHDAVAAPAVVKWSRCWCGPMFGRDARCPVPASECDQG
jgi:hypothetical protein